MSSSPSFRLSDVDEAALVAYLDGELDDDAVRAIERRLSAEPQYQQRLQQLQRAWDLLDELPRAEATETFTRSTVEIVALNVEQELAATQVLVQRKRITWRIAVPIALVAVLALGFGIGKWLWPAPDQKLIQDLRVVENVELYLQADSLDFLKQLEREQLFPEEPTNAP